MFIVVVFIHHFSCTGFQLKPTQRYSIIKDSWYMWGWLKPLGSCVNKAEAAKQPYLTMCQPLLLPLPGLEKEKGNQAEQENCRNRAEHPRQGEGAFCQLAAGVSSLPYLGFMDALGEQSLLALSGWWYHPGSCPEGMGRMTFKLQSLGLKRGEDASAQDSCSLRAQS